MIRHARGHHPSHHGQSGTVLWGNARTPAVGFYEGFGFAQEGAEFDLPGIGPHVVMRRRVDGPEG